MKAPASLLVLALVWLAAAPATAQEASAAHTAPIAHPFGVSLRIGAPVSPLGHVGIPTVDQYHLAPELAVRWQLDARSAIDGGVGLPHAGLGLGLWVAYELFDRAWADPGGVVALELYLAPGLGLGWDGPDGYAHRYQVFVGYDTVVGGDFVFDARLASGMRFSWANGSFDTSIEALPIVTFAPTVDVLFSLVLDLRARF